MRKRSMHLPFTYATGEALLYQSNHPIAGFGDGSQEKNSSKSKKSRTERMAKDGLKPGSLLGALMSQDESVYVCQPAPEPKVSLHSSFFADHMGFPVSESSSLHRRWEVPNNGAISLGHPEPASSFDPLLATLDSLSLGGQGVADVEEEGCSNGELFGALEGLGLSAEDLELLLLDERMIRVEMDPERVPTLDDLLTNDEILSYIHDSLDLKPDPTGARGGQVRLGNARETTSTATVSLPESNPTSDTNMQTQCPHRKPPLVGQAPIVQLSQQMQQHLNMQPGKVVHNWNQQTEHLPQTLVNGDLLEQNQSVPNGQWTAQDILVSAGIQLENYHTQQTLFNGKTSDLNRELHQQHQCYQFQSRMQSQLPQQCHARQKATNLNGLCGISSTNHPAGKSLWTDSCLSNGQTNTSHDVCMDYGMSDMDNVDYTLSGGALFGRRGQQHGAESTVLSFQGVNHKRQQEQIPVPLAQVLSSLSQCPPPNASLEQILGVGQLDHYSVVTSDITHTSSHSKVSQVKVSVHMRKFLSELGH